MTSKNIYTIVDDIYSVFNSGYDIPPELLEEFQHNVVNLLKKRIAVDSRPRGGDLYMSNIGRHPKQLWHEARMEPTIRTEPGGRQDLMFLYGDLIEEVILFLAQVAGHEVRGRQDRCEIHGVRGKRDAVIDGYTVDVKSTSPIQFGKFVKGEIEDEGGFGYVPQLSGYMQAFDDTKKDTAFFLAMDKSNGALCLTAIGRTRQPDMYEFIAERKKMIESDTPPTTDCHTKESGTAGNMELAYPCNYCPCKEKCNPGLRAFKYANGIRYFTKVVKEPRVPEVNLETGEIIEQAQEDKGT